MQYINIISLRHITPMKTACTLIIYKIIYKITYYSQVDTFCRVQKYQSQSKLRTAATSVEYELIMTDRKATRS